MICLGTDVNGDQRVWLGAGGRLAAGDEVGAGPADGVFDDVGDEGGEDDGNGKGEVGDLVLVGRGASDEVGQNQDSEGYEESIDKIHGYVVRRGQHPGARLILEEVSTY